MDRVPIAGKPCEGFGEDGSCPNELPNGCGLKQWGLLLGSMF